MPLFLAQSAILYDYKGLLEDTAPCIKGHWRTEHSLHATALFLGDKFTEKEIVRTVMNCEYILEDAFLKGLGRFQHNRIFYAAAEHPTLVETHRALSRAFNMYPDRHYLPHITLMRYKSIDTACFEAERTHNENIILGKVGGPLKLLRSTPTPEGSVYELVHQF